MAVLLTDAFTGTNGTAVSASNWVLGHTGSAGASATIQNNTGRWLCGTRTDSNFSGSGISRRFNITNVADIEVTGTYTATGECEPLIYVRDVGSWGSLDRESGYSLRLPTPGGGGSTELRKYTSYTGTLIGSSVAFTATAGVRYGFRFRVVGTTLQGRIWNTSSAEPGTWTITATDSTITAAGKGGLAIQPGSTASVYLDFDDITVTDGVNADPNPTVTETSTAADDNATIAATLPTIDDAATATDDAAVSVLLPGVSDDAVALEQDATVMPGWDVTDNPITILEDAGVSASTTAGETVAASDDAGVVVAVSGDDEPAASSDAAVGGPDPNVYVSETLGVSNETASVAVLGSTSPWQTTYVAWDHEDTTIIDLAPATTYEWQIRAVDYASPINYGAWSDSRYVSTGSDTIAPPTPAPPTVAASKLQVQVTHTLGNADGGEYNLPLDLDHLEIHVGATNAFTATDASRVGKLVANAGMITGRIKVVGSFPVDQTLLAGETAYVRVVAVDKTGNKSPASAAVTATAELVDSAWISDLTASKITAGTLSAAYILGGSIKTGTTGARVEQDTDGIRLYNSSGVKTADISTVTGDVSILGRFRTSSTGRRIEIVPDNNGTIYFYPASGNDYAFINAPSSNSVGINSGNGNGPYRTRFWAMPTSAEMKFMYSDQSDQSQAGGWIIVNADGIRMSVLSSDTIRATHPSGSLVEIGSSSYIYGNNTMTASALSGDLYLRSDSGVVWVNGATAVNVNAPGVSLYTTGGAYISAGSSYAQLTTSTFNVVSSTFKADAVYDSTAANGANVYVGPNKVLFRATSSAKRKVQIRTLDVDPADVLALRPTSFYDRGEWESNEGDVGKCSPLGGFIAEEVAEVPGVGAFLTELDADGSPESVNYDRVPAFQQVVLRDHDARLAALEEAILGAAVRPAPGRFPKRTYRDGRPRKSRAGWLKRIAEEADSAAGVVVTDVADVTVP